MLQWMDALLITQLAAYKSKSQREGEIHMQFMHAEQFADPNAAADSLSTLSPCKCT